ncbi:hypothetical protein AAIR29_07535 [Psychrobacter sp. FBL11]|uniref:Uncharacterized protein n=1 Tax=Psychrobacter saeujeotis TaxID=3143436 RepID=A0ABU9X931_9GAMM|nr:hypothetical protein [uncultured Psychrobacter sp.]
MIKPSSGGFLVLVLSTPAQAREHDYQQHTPTLTQTSLGGQHLAERLNPARNRTGTQP